MSIDNQVDDFLGEFESIIESAFEVVIEGIKEAFNFRFQKKSVKIAKAIALLIIAMTTAIIYKNTSEVTLLYSDALSKYDNLAFFLYKENITKILGVFIPIIYLLIIGYRRYRIVKMIEFNMLGIGFISRNKKKRKDTDGRYIQVNLTPKLLNYVRLDDDLEMYIFQVKGTTIDKWERFKPGIEDFLARKIVKMEKSRTGRSVTLIAATQQKYEEIIEENRTIEEYDNIFEKVGLVGKGTRNRKFLGKELKEKNYPLFEKSEDKSINGKRVTTRTFKSIGTELQDWKDSKYKLENVFNCIVHEIRQIGHNKQLFEIVTLDLKDDLKELYPWKDNFINKEDGVLTLGEGLLDKITIDLNKTPHLLIGGVTGAGKSVLTNCLAWQLVKQGAHIVPIDFKGGIELGMFSPFNEVISELPKVLLKLTELKKEHEERLVAFKEIGVKNILEYNEKVAQEERLCRCLLVIDEIAEMLDATGRSKDEVARIVAIEGELNTLARLSRSTGINIIAGTQRPDAKVLNGQIKNNLGGRICGRMTDKEPSIMVLGSPDAIRIPDIKGRYLFSIGSDPIPFQAYWFKDEYVKYGNYRKGCLLTIAEDQKASSNKNSKKNKERIYEDFEEVDDVDDITNEKENLKNKKQGFENKNMDFENEDEDTENSKEENDDGINYEDDNDTDDPLAEEDFEPVEEIIDVTLDDDDFEEVI